MSLDIERDSDLFQMLGLSARDAQTSLWNALLTLNGIMIGAISILTALAKVNKYLALALVACSVISSLLLLTNFNSLVTSSQDILVNALRRSQATQVSSARLDQIQSRSGDRFRRTFVAQLLILAEAVILSVGIYYL